MEVKCVWEHNGCDTLLYATDYIGAYTRGKNLEEALDKMPREIKSYQLWSNQDVNDDMEFVIVQDVNSSLFICDADSDVIFDSEKAPMSERKYKRLKSLALKSAKDFLFLYNSIPDKSSVFPPERKTFYGKVPRSAHSMYEHTKNVNKYYFSEIGIDADNNGDIYECRRRGFDELERNENFLSNGIIEGSYGELWSLRKVIRRFIWHDRIHAKAMYRMVIKASQLTKIPNPFYF